jgi:hypothetical protein
MMEEARLAYVKMRETDLTATPDIAWEWLANGEQLFPEVAHDRVIWNYDHVDSPWHSAFTTGLQPREVYIGDNLIVENGRPVTFDMDEIRAKSTEASMRLHSKLS